MSRKNKARKKSLSYKVFFCLWLLSIAFFFTIAFAGIKYLPNEDAGDILFITALVGIIMFILWIISIGGIDPIKGIYRIARRLPRLARLIVILVLAIGLISLGNKAYAYVDAQSAILRAQELNNIGEFDSAKDIIDKVLIKRLSSAQTDQANELERKIESEKENEQVFTEANEKYKSELWEEARELFKKINSSSHFYNDSTHKVEDCNKKIIESLKTRAVELAKKYNVYWGESWANRDKRSAEEILANYNEESLRKFIEKWENYSGGIRKESLSNSIKPTPIPIPSSTWSPDLNNEPKDYTNRIPEFENEIYKCKLALEEAKSNLREIDPIHEQHLQEIEEWYNNQPKVDHCRSCGGVSCCYTEQSDEVKAERKRRIDAENSSYFSLQSSLNSKISSIPNYEIPSIQWIIDNIKSKTLLSPPETYSYSTCN